MKFRNIAAYVIALLAFARFAEGAAPIRVACVGDSITQGFGIGNPGQDGYPAQLARILGPKCEVKNLGVSGTTLTRHGDIPYWNTDALKQAQAFAPQIVVIMLGTNDCIPRNQKPFLSDFVADYKDLVKVFTNLDSHPKIWICTLAPVVPPDYANAHHLYIQSIDGKTEDTQCLPRIARVASDAGVPLIDIHAAMANHFDLFCDSVHPNVQGAKVIAQTVYDAIKNTATSLSER